MRHLFGLAMACMIAGCTTPFKGTVHDAPDMSHTNSGSATFEKDGYLHVRPAYTVDTETPEQHVAARAAHDAYFKDINARKRAALDAMTPEQRHATICAEIAADIQVASGLPPVSPGDPTFMDPLILYHREGCG